MSLRIHLETKLIVLEQKNFRRWSEIKQKKIFFGVSANETPSSNIFSLSSSKKCY